MTKEEIQKNSEHWYNKYKDAEKRIAELETRCNELFLQNNEFAEQLTKAKDIIEKLISDNRKVWIYSDVREQAEQFLKDSEGK